MNRLAELDLSYRRAADRSGGLVGYATLNNIVLGVRQPVHYNEDTLRGISLALDVPLSRVREAAGEVPKTPTEFRLPKRASRLSPKQRRAILSMVDALLDQQSS